MGWKEPPESEGMLADMVLIKLRKWLMIFLSMDASRSTTKRMKLSFLAAENNFTSASWSLPQPFIYKKMAGFLVSSQPSIFYEMAGFVLDML